MWKHRELNMELGRGGPSCFTTIGLNERDVMAEGPES